MAIIRSGPTRIGGRQRGGANLAQQGAAYEASVLRKVMDPALTAFGSSLGQGAGQAIGAGTGKGVVGAIGGLLADQSLKPQDAVQSADAIMQQILQTYTGKKDGAGNVILGNIADLYNNEKLKAVGMDPEDIKRLRGAIELRDSAIAESWRRTQLQQQEQGWE